MVNMCLFPEVDVLQSVTKSMAILSNWSVRDFCHLQGILLNLGFVSSAKDAVCNIFPDVLIHAFPIILALDQAVCMVVSLMSQFIMGFH